MSNIQSIFTPNAPTPAGHYSQAIVHNGIVYVSGVLAVDKAGNKLVEASVEEQTEVVFQTIESILKAAGSSLNRILSVTIFMNDVSDWGKINETYARIMGEHRPARAALPAPGLHYGLKLEVTVIAAV